MRITIIIPVYNEEKYLGEFIQKLKNELKQVNYSVQVIFVNDGSTDSTAEILQNAGIENKLILTARDNQGKGASMKQGFEQARHISDAVIFMDGDLQHNPKHISEFIEALKEHSLVFGYRKLSDDAPFIRKLGNDVARFLFRNFFNIRRYDLLCGFIAIREDMFHLMKWKSRDYGVELELAVIVGKKKLSFKEILIDTIYYDSKKGVNLVDAALILLKIPYWYLLY